MTLCEESNFVAKISALDITIGKVYRAKKQFGRYLFIDDDHCERRWSEERFLNCFQVAKLSPDEEFRNALLQL